MIVTVTPHGGAATILDPLGDVSYSESVPGGYDSASFTAAVAPSIRESLLLAPVKIQPVTGAPWQGFISSVSEPSGGVCEVEAAGWSECLSRNRREALYCDTRTSEWKTRTHVNVSNAMSPQVDGSNLRVVMLPGYSVPVGAYHGFYRLIPTTTSSRVKFSWVTTSSNWEWRLYYGTYSPDPANGGEAYWNWAWTSSGTSGTCDKTINASHDCLMLRIVRTTSTTTSISESHYVYDMKVYGVAGVTSSTVSNVLGNILDQLPSSCLPSDSAYRAYVASDPTVIEPLVFDMSTSSADHLSELLEYTTSEFGFWSRRINGVWTPVPVLRAASTTPDYICRVDGEVIVSDMTGIDIEPLASNVRVKYSTEDGRTVYTDRADTNASHYLVQHGIAKWADISADTTSLTLAQTIGDNYLSTAGEVQVAGDITIATPIYDSVGGQVLPCEIEAGRRIRILGLSSGSVDARIVSVAKIGNFQAVVTVSNKPRSLDVELARLAKRAS